MKRTGFILALLLSTFIVSKAQDQITLHNGNIAKGEVLESNQSYIKFIYEGETTVTTIGKIAIANIKYRSGRIENCTDKIVITNPKKEYDKIYILREEEDSEGLVRIKEITSKSGGFWAWSDNEGKYLKKNLKKLQIAAAEMGGCAVLITSQIGNNGNLFTSAHSNVSAIVYKY